MCMVNAKRMVVLAAAAAAACLAANGMVRAASQSIVVANPSFEDNSISTYPGYGAINNWTSTNTSNTGVNLSSGPFATGTTIPDGGQVAFIQSNFTTGSTGESLSQALSGLIPGEQYWFQLFYNARQNYSQPTLSVTYGIQSLANIANIPVNNPNYTFLNVPFTPTTSSGTLTISNNDTTTSGNSALLLDAISVIERGAGQVVIANPSFQGSSADLQLFNGGDGYSPAIAGWTIGGSSVFTGVNKLGGPFYDNGVAPDGTKVAYLQHFNTNPATTISQTLGGLIAGDTYKLTFYYNARAATADPLMEVSLGGTTFTPTGGLDVAPVGGSNPFYEGQYFYTATGPTAVLSFGNINPTASDSSLLLNDVSLQVVPEPAALGLMGAMGVGLLVVGRKRKRA